MADDGGQALHLRETDVTSREVGDELIVLRVSTGTYLTLNAVGRELWTALESGATEQELVAGIVERHGIEQGQAAADVEAFLSELRAKDLLVDS